MLKTKVMLKKQTSLGIERQSDFPMVLYILKNDVNKFLEIISNFLEVLSPILKYHHGQKQGYVKKINTSWH